VCEIFEFDKNLLIKGTQPANALVKRSKNIALNVNEIKQKYNIRLHLEEGLSELKNDLEIQ
jgi:hypothetical protein